jgi:hypothetical protein
VPYHANPTREDAEDGAHPRLSLLPGRGHLPLDDAGRRTLVGDSFGSLRRTGWPTPIPVQFWHLDIKPSDILLTQNEITLGNVRINDFGTSAIAQSDFVTGGWTGSCKYPALEILACVAVTNKVDIYSCGPMLHFRTAPNAALPNGAGPDGGLFGAAVR